jgi:hypothetical protein
MCERARTANSCVYENDTKDPNPVVYVLDDEHLPSTRSLGSARRLLVPTNTVRVLLIELNLHGTVHHGIVQCRLAREKVRWSSIGCLAQEG